jgi:hypothetical protein
VLRPDEVRRFLQRVVFPEMRGDRRVPLTVISAVTGIDRKYLYDVIMGAGACGLLRVADAADPPGRGSQLPFRRTAPRSSGPKAWEIIET